MIVTQVSSSQPYWYNKAKTLSVLAQKWQGIEPDSQTLCGMTNIVNINSALTDLSIPKVNATTLVSLQQQYLNETTSQGELAVKNQLQDEMEIKMVEYEAVNSANGTKLDSIKTELNLINCTEVIVQKWKEVMKLYVDFLKNNGIVPSQNMAATLSYSTDCSDIYGDVVHLARAMALTFDSTNFEVNDSCLGGTNPRTIQSDKARFDSKVFPNPSFGIINIKLSNFDGIIFVKSSDGRLIHTKLVENSQLESFDLSIRSGVYFIELISSTGEKTTHKVIIIE